MCPFCFVLELETDNHDHVADIKTTTTGKFCSHPRISVLARFGLELGLGFGPVADPSAGSLRCRCTRVCGSIAYVGVIITPPAAHYPT